MFNFTMAMRPATARPFSPQQRMPPRLPPAPWMPLLPPRPRKFPDNDSAEDCDGEEDDDDDDDDDDGDDDDGNDDSCDDEHSDDGKC